MFFVEFFTPIVLSLLVIGMLLYLFISTIVSDFDFHTLPTISVMGCDYPELGVFIIFCCLISMFICVLTYNKFVQMKRFKKVLNNFCGVLLGILLLIFAFFTVIPLIATSAFSCAYNDLLHSIFAILVFFSLTFLFIVWSFIDFYQLIRVKELRKVFYVLLVITRFIVNGVIQLAVIITVLILHYVLEDKTAQQDAYAIGEYVFMFLMVVFYFGVSIELIFEKRAVKNIESSQDDYYNLEINNNIATSTEKDVRF